MYQRDGTQLDFWLADRGPLWFTVVGVTLTELAWAMLGLLVAMLAGVMLGEAAGALVLMAVVAIGAAYVEWLR